MTKTKRYIREQTESGDYYSATQELWDQYNDAVDRGNDLEMLYLEEGNNPDFFYDPQE